jgi:hypothetical protein
VEGLAVQAIFFVPHVNSRECSTWNICVVCYRCLALFAKNIGLHSPTGSQFHKIQGLWNCGIAGSILRELASQSHRFTKSSVCGTVKLWSTCACRPNIGCSTADVTQVPKKCTVSVKQGEGGVHIHSLRGSRACTRLNPASLTLLLCAGRGIFSARSVVTCLLDGAKGQLTSWNPPLPQRPHQRQDQGWGTHPIQWDSKGGPPADYDVLIGCRNRVIAAR